MDTITNIIPLALRTILVGVAPVVLAVLVAGLVSGIIGRFFGVSDSALSFSLKVLSVLLALALTAPILSVLITTLLKEAFA